MLNNVGPSGLVLIAVVVLVLFGRGKVASLMSEVGNGIASFKRGLKAGREDGEPASGPALPEEARPSDQQRV